MFSDFFIEQGFGVKNTGKVLNFMKTYSNTNYVITTSTNGLGSWGHILVGTYTTTSFTAVLRYQGTEYAQSGGYHIYGY